MPPLTSPKTLECAICGAGLAAQRDLDKHLCLVHDDCSAARVGPPITFRCASCEEAFARRSELYAHQNACGHGHPAEWDLAQPAGVPRPHGWRLRRRG
jgi:hypothetical protein